MNHCPLKDGSASISQEDVLLFCSVHACTHIKRRIQQKSNKAREKILMNPHPGTRRSWEGRKSTEDLELGFSDTRRTTNLGLNDLTSKIKDLD